MKQKREFELTHGMLLFLLVLVAAAATTTTTTQERVIISEKFIKQLTTIEATIPLLQFTAFGQAYSLQLERWDSLYTKNYQSLLLRNDHQNNGTYKLIQSKRKPTCVFRAQDVINANFVGTASFCNQMFQLTILDRTNASNTFSIVPQEEEMVGHVAFRHLDVPAQPRYGCETPMFPPKFAQRIVTAAGKLQRRRHQFPYGKRTKVVQMFVVNDATRTSGFSSFMEAEQDTAVVLGIVNTLYEAFPTSPNSYRVQFKLSGQLSIFGTRGDAWLVPTTEEGQVPASQLLNGFNNWWTKNDQVPRNDIKQDMTLLFSGRAFHGGTVGIAYVGGVCTKANTGVIQLSQWDHSIYGKIVAHEAGHVLGMSHDNALGACNSDPNVIMWSNIPLEPGTTWSKCSAEAFKSQVEYGLALCLEDGGGGWW